MAACEHDRMGTQNPKGVGHPVDASDRQAKQTGSGASAQKFKGPYGWCVGVELAPRCVPDQH